MKKLAVYLMILVLAFAFSGCNPEKPSEDDTISLEPGISETTEEPNEVPKEIPQEGIAEQSEPEEPEYPTLKELCLLAKDAMYFHCHTMDGVDFYEYGGFDDPKSITKEGLYNFFIAKNDGNNFLDEDKLEYRILKKDVIDFYSDYFYDTSFLEEMLDERYSTSFFSAYKEENVIFNDDPQMVIDGDKATVKTDDYEAVFLIRDGKAYYESFKVTAYRKMDLQTEIFLTDPENETSIDEKVCMTSFAYPDWSYVRTNSGTYDSRRDEPFGYSEKLLLYHTDDLRESFGTVTIYKDSGTTFDELLRIHSILVFDEDIIAVENISSEAEKACYVKFTYPAKDEPNRYLRIYLIQFDGYVANANIYIDYSDQRQQEGECGEFISGLKIYPME